MAATANGEADWLVELQNDQLRACAADIVAAVAHALGSPLNVISGRAEMLRRDPANYDAQLTRIEQQVQKLANGMRELVDYLALAEPPKELVSAEAALEDAMSQVRPLAERLGVKLRLDTELGSALADRRHVLSMLSPLLVLSTRLAAGDAATGAAVELCVRGQLDGSSILIELQVPGILVAEGWQLEHFQPRPKNDAAICQVLSICGALARGRGGRLQVEPRAWEIAGRTVQGALVRWSFRAEKS